MPSAEASWVCLEMTRDLPVDRVHRTVLRLPTPHPTAEGREALIRRTQLERR